jgi:hypothetical protein
MTDQPLIEQSTDPATEQPTEATTDPRIKNVGFLDLRYAKTEQDLEGIVSMTDVGMVLVPEHLAGALAKVAMKNVGAVVPIPTDVKVASFTGQVRLSGESLAAGDPETILLVAGQAFITGEVTTVGYKEIRVFGQIFAPREGKAVISAKLTQLSGQNFYLPADARTIMGEQTIGREFLELLPAPTAIVVMGKLTLENDVTRELLQAKVEEIVLMGEIHAPKGLLPMLEVLTKERMGDIVAVE